MGAPVQFGTGSSGKDPIMACTNQKGGFNVVMVPPQSGTLAGSVWTCQIRNGAQPATPVLTPTLTRTDNPAGYATGSVELAYSWTVEQSAALVAGGSTFNQYTDYTIDIEGAFADDPTQPAMRFVGILRVAPGGNV